MIALIAYYWYALLIAFGIGLVTAWWTWGQQPTAAPIEIDPDDELIDWPSDGPAPPEAPQALADSDTATDSVVIALPDASAVPQDETIEAETPPDAEPEPESGTAETADAAQEAHETDEPVLSPADEFGQAIAAAASAATEPDAPAEVVAEAEADDSGAPDDLMIIKGIGPQLDALLRSLGIQRFQDIADWMPEDIERVDGQLGIFKGRIIRDEWIGQARLLAKGDMETFNQRYGHLS